jgi:hypothetical protein
MKSKVSVKTNFAVVQPPVESYTLTLTLTPADAAAILSMTNFIGGDPDTTARGVFDKIRGELQLAGVVERGSFLDHRSLNSIRFKS